MTRQDRRLERHVDAVLRDRRPPASELGDDAAAAHVAARLHAAHPGAAEPSPRYVDELARRLRQAQSQPDAPPMPDRRRLLGAAGLAAAAGIGAGFGVDRLLAAGGGGAAQETLQPADGAWVAVTTLAAVRTQGAVRFTQGGVTGYVLEWNGTLQALSAACTDQGCILDADTTRQRLVCPCHGATFDYRGTPDTRPAYNRPVTALPRVAVRASGDSVEVLVPRSA